MPDALSPQDPDAGRQPRWAEVFLFLPAWGAFLGLWVGLIEKSLLYYSASEIAGKIYATLLAVLVVAGLVAGIASCLVAAILLVFKARPRTALTVAASLALALMVQVLVSVHPEYFGFDDVPLFGETLLRKGLAAAAVFVLSAALAMRAGRPILSLLAVASALLAGFPLSRFFPSESMLNAISIPLLGFLLVAIVVRLSGRRAIPYAVACVVLTFGYFGVSAARGVTAPPAVMKNKPAGRAARAALVGERPNVLVIVLDTLRADRVSFLGCPRDTTPEIDRFLEGATCYPNAKSTSCWTLPAHGSLFTGLWPRTHGAHFAVLERAHNGLPGIAAIAYPMRGDVTTLPQVMSRQGYYTGAIVANFGWLDPYFGFRRGFDYYQCAPRYQQSRIAGKFESQAVSLLLENLMRGVDLYRQTNCNYLMGYFRAQEITQEALSWMNERRGDRFFLFLNYLDAHSPYNPPAPYDAKFPGRRSRRGTIVNSMDGGGPVMRNEQDLEEWRSEELFSQYDGDVAYLDYWIGRLFEGMKEADLYDDCIIVLLSDHGESLGEHRFLDHCCGLYEEEVGMLLGVKSAGQREGSVDNRLVQTHDVMPTIMRDLHILTDFPMEGQPLDQVTHPVVGELFPPLPLVKRFGERFDRTLAAVYSPQAKVIHSSNGTIEVYDLASDPGEAVDLSQSHPLDEFLATLEDWRRQHPAYLPSELEQPNKELLERLKSIGYI